MEVSTRSGNFEVSCLCTETLVSWVANVKGIYVISLSLILIEEARSAATKDGGLSKKAQSFDFAEVFYLVILCSLEGYFLTDVHSVETR